MPADPGRDRDATATARDGSGGVIHDIGYRAYEGQRLARPHITAALCWHSLRSAFGIGRGARAKIVPILTFVIMCLPAVLNAVILALSSAHQRQVSYDTYVPQLRILVLLVFIAAQAPELVSRDLRSHCLPLYFARPVRRIDYPAAKLAALFLACLAMIEIPLLLLYLGTVAQVHGGSAIWSQTSTRARAAAGGRLGPGAGRARAAAGLAQRAARLCHRRGRHLLLPQPDTGHAAHSDRRPRAS